MEKFALQALAFLGSLIVLFVLSVPFHELFHVLTIKIFGGKMVGKNKIAWFRFRFQVSRKGIQVEIGGGGEFEAVFPDCLEKYSKTIAFLIALSGGLGTAIVYIGIALLFSFPDILNWIRIPLILIGGFHFVHAIREAMDNDIKFVE